MLLRCAKCDGALRRNHYYWLELEAVCKPCHRRYRKGKWETCAACRRDKPANESYFYKKARSEGLSAVCRRCRDRRHRRGRKPRRTCSRCALLLSYPSFTQSEWKKQLDEPVVCRTCLDKPNQNRPVPAVNEKYCPRCNRCLDMAAHFYSRRYGGTSSYCRDCLREYNKDRYHRLSAAGGADANSMAQIQYLLAMDEQERMDRIAAGEIIRPPKGHRPMTGGFVKASRKQVKRFVDDFQRSIGITPESLENEKTRKTKKRSGSHNHKEAEEEDDGDLPEGVKITIKIRRRSKKRRNNG